MAFYTTIRLSMAAALTSAALAILPAHAFALDGQDLLKKINAAYGSGQANIAATGIDITGDKVLLKNVSLNPQGKPETAVSLGDIHLSGVVANDDGSYEIDRVDFQPINLSEDQSTITARDLYLQHVTVPAKTGGQDLSSILFYENAHIGPVSITNQGKPVLSLAESNSNMAVDDDGAALTFDGNIKGLTLDLSETGDLKTQEAIDSLHLRSIKADSHFKGSWELQSGTIDMEEITADIANTGKLRLAFSVSGYTPELIRQLQETSQRLNAAAGDETSKAQAQQAAGLAMLGLMQQLSFLGADIRFDDKGITRRALDYSGAQQGVSGKDMANMLKAMVPLMLAQANLGSIQESASRAVNSFLDHPGNLTISADPQNPVPFPMIAGAAMGAPDTLPKVLGLTITANQPQP